MMKTFTFKIATICCLLAVVLLASCKKDKDEPGVEATGTATLTLVNASPFIGTYNIYIDKAKMNTSPLSSGGTVNYFDLPSGSRTLQVSSASSTDTLLTKAVSLANEKVYSFFLIGQSGQLDGITTNDVMTTVTDKASLRLANMCPDAPALDLVVEATDATITLVTNQFYKTVSSFVALAPKTYNISVREKATGTVRATVSNVAVSGGKYYTVLVKGMITPANVEHPITAQLITNK